MVGFGPADPGESSPCLTDVRLLLDQPVRVALEVWLERIPTLSLADPAAVTWPTGQVRGPRTLWLRIA
ncbi:hypothetical protein ACQP1V_25870 [Microtetraspora malaysiensis]|uniref:hypothetical protein n=1 Tax=Microtetraspora malaysiensis TaxID=161358 RepID=UPI003D8A51DE